MHSEEHLWDVRYRMELPFTKTKGLHEEQDWVENQNKLSCPWLLIQIRPSLSMKTGVMPEQQAWIRAYCVSVSQSLFSLRFIYLYLYWYLFQRWSGKKKTRSYTCWFTPNACNKWGLEYVEVRSQELPGSSIRVAWMQNKRNHPLPPTASGWKMGGRVGTWSSPITLPLNSQVEGLLNKWIQDVRGSDRAGSILR